jgi:hypothetical protein
LTALARFGAERLPAVADDQTIRPRAALVAAVTAFHDPLASADIDEVYRLVIDDETFDLHCTEGRLHRPRNEASPTLTIVATGAALMQIRQGDVQIDDAIADGRVDVIGSKRALQRFRRVFALSP